MAREAFLTVLFVVLPFISSAQADFSCPPYQDQSTCLEGAWIRFEKCKTDMGELLHDKDALTLRYHAFYMINGGCANAHEIDKRGCVQGCP